MHKNGLLGGNSSGLRPLLGAKQLGLQFHEIIFIPEDPPGKVRQTDDNCKTSQLGCFDCQ